MKYSWQHYLADFFLPIDHWRSWNKDNYKSINMNVEQTERRLVKQNSWSFSIPRKTRWTNDLFFDLSFLLHFEFNDIEIIFLNLDLCSNFTEMHLFRSGIFLFTHKSIDGFELFFHILLNEVNCFLLNIKTRTNSIFVNSWYTLVLNEERLANF